MTEEAGFNKITTAKGNAKKAMPSLAVAVGALFLSACVSINPIQPSSSGYDAIEFTRATVVRDHAWNQYVFAAGRRFIGDRRDAKGRTLYCGLVTINATDTHPIDACFGFIAPNTLIIAPNYGFKEVERPQAPGTIKMIKVKP